MTDAGDRAAKCAEPRRKARERACAAAGAAGFGSGDFNRFAAELLAVKTRRQGGR